MTRNRRGPQRSQPHSLDARPAPGPEFEPLDYDQVQLDTPQSGEERARGAEFIRLFNEIDHYVKRIVGSNGGEGFFRRLQWAVRDNPALKRYIDDLMEYSELRNAMVHDRRFPNEMIAVPTESTLSSFRRMVERIVRPRRVVPEFASELRVFNPEEPLGEALEYMHRQGFTQVVARDKGELRLLTAAGVTRWLAAHLAEPNSEAPAGGSVHDKCVDLAGATVADVLLLEKPEALGLIARGATIEEAADLFQTTVAKGRGRLFAVVITEHGQPDEEPLGIITPADLLDEE